MEFVNPGDHQLGAELSTLPSLAAIFSLLYFGLTLLFVYRMWRYRYAWLVQLILTASSSC